jgi:hypothetical protein
MEYIFYEIKCNDSNITEFYIGSTINFTRRKCEHKSMCNNEANKKYNLKIYCIIRENGGWINWTMSPIDKQVFETKIDARIYENKLMQERNSTLNTYNAYLDEKEYQKEYQKEYRENHKEHIKEYQKEYQKEYYQKNKAKGII